MILVGRIESQQSILLNTRNLVTSIAPVANMRYDDDGGGFDDELGEHGLVGHLVSIASGRYCSRRLFLHFSHIFINQFYRLCSFYIVFAINGL